MKTKSCASNCFKSNLKERALCKVWKSQIQKSIFFFQPDPERKPFNIKETSWWKSMQKSSIKFHSNCLPSHYKLFDFYSLLQPWVSNFEVFLSIKKYIYCKPVNLQVYRLCAHWLDNRSTIGFSHSLFFFILFKSDYPLLKLKLKNKYW